MAIHTLTELFLVAAGHRKPDCLMTKVDGEYRPISTVDLVAGVKQLSQALAERGVGAGDRVGLMADNGPHWPTIDFATLSLGAATVPIYPTVLPEQAAYIARDSGMKVAFLENREQLEGLLEHRGELPDCELFVLLAGTLSEDETSAGDVLTFEALMLSVEEVDDEAFGDRLHQVEPDHLASLVYTSGTTGDPKGVMLSHRAFVSNVRAAIGLLDIRKDQVALSFLPLSHVFERMVDFAYFHQGTTIAYAESVRTVATNLAEVRPHIFVSVPRVYEKVLARVLENVEKGSGLKRRIFEWARRVGRRSLQWRLRGTTPPGLLGVQLGLADRLVFGKIRDRLGGRFEYAISGGAPLGRDVAEFFWAAGVPIYEGYGLTETAPVIAVNVPCAVKLGTVGRIIPTGEVKIAEDGEILYQGPNVMIGYFGRPDESRKAIDEEGWFHTGDIGHLDDEGFLVITDRKKEIIVNAYGKNVAPAPIENQLKSSRFIAQAVVIGDRRKFLSALLVPDFEALATWAAANELGDRAPEELVREEGVRALFEAEVTAVNEELAHYEEVQKWALLPAELTLEGGELTPTQKIKRRVVAEKYRDRIESIYAS